ncbi:hypothetical protein HY3_05425 [Hyphomonas pacifica]|uniref:Uncharacterized protein n=1 Tax=Hyphomonas pacifica TaxID=1280941 RepID=A0A062U210_9PROT|nr:hypothetical protein HY2_10835 [Hyphomonas pacifica]RAN30589.1 hypothetical protein HY3_05425 [Hyphomonas pacifica]
MLITAAMSLPATAQQGETPSLHDDPVYAPATDDDYTYDEYDDGNEPLATDLNALERAHRDFLRNGEMQLERPEAEQIVPPDIKPPPQWLTSLLNFLSHLGPVFQFLFWAIIIAIVGGVLYFLFGEALRVRFGGDGSSKDKDGDDVIPDYRPEAAVARSLLEEADALARQGKFAEAVHLLLFRSIEDIQTRLEGGVPRSLTAREIGSLRYLPDRVRAALNPIIRIVEHSFFGGRDVNEANWKTARASYEDFAFGGEWS